METTSPSEAPPLPGKKRRWLRILALLLVALPLLAVAAGWLALCSASFRQAVLAEISRSFEASSGIRATAADFRAPG